MSVTSSAFLPLSLQTGITPAFVAWGTVDRSGPRGLGVALRPGRQPPNSPAGSNLSKRTSLRCCRSASRKICWYGVRAVTMPSAVATDDWINQPAADAPQHFQRHHPLALQLAPQAQRPSLRVGEPIRWHRGNDRAPDLLLNQRRTRGGRRRVPVAIARLHPVFLMASWHCRASNAAVGTQK